ncbi:unnamed protein product [Cunninghamella blakesleeana]
MKSNSLKKSKPTLNLTKVVTLGTEKGTILIYSLDDDKVIKTLRTRTNTPIADIVFNEQGTIAYSISKIGTITEWNIKEELPNIEWKTKEVHTIYKGALSPDQSLLAVAGNAKVELWDISKTKLIKLFQPGSKYEIDQLLFSKNNDILVCKGKNSLKFFNSLPTNKNSTPISTLPVEDGVKHFDIIDKDHEHMDILVVSDKGMVHIWQSVNILKESKDSSNNNKNKNNTDDTNNTWSKTRIKVVTNNKKLIPISWAIFTKSKNTTSIIIARGSSVKPLLETVGYTTVSNKLLDNIILTRQSPNITEAKNKKSGEVDEKEDDDNEDDDDIMEERNGTNVKNVDIKAMDFNYENFIQVIKLDDQKKTIQFLTSSSSYDKEQIENVLQRLPLSCVHTLAIHLVDEMQRKMIKDPILLVWLKQLVLVHYDYLMSSQLVVKKLAELSRSLKLQATTTLPKVLSLRGRVEMIQQQIYLRNHRSMLDEADAHITIDSLEDDDIDHDDHDDDDDDDDDIDLLSDDDEDHLNGAHVFNESDKDEEMFLEEMGEEEDIEEDSDLENSDASM